MKKYRNKAHEFFSEMSDDDFFGFFKNCGLELEPGDGKIIYTEKEQTMEDLMETISESYHSNKESRATLILEELKVKKGKHNTQLVFKNLKRSFEYDGYGVA